MFEVVFFFSMMVVCDNLLPVDDQAERTDIYFSHDYNDQGQPFCSDLSHKLVNLIATAKKKVLMAIYMITDEKVATAVIEAKKTHPEMEVAIIVDESTVEYPSGKAIFLSENGVPVYVFNFSKLRSCKKTGKCCNDKKVIKVCEGMPGYKQAIMHNKYVVVDDILWTGSFNFTYRANYHNQENVLVTTNRDVVGKAEVNFRNHLVHSDLLIPNEICGRSFVRKKMPKLRNKAGLRTKRITDYQESFFALAKRWYKDVCFWCGKLKQNVVLLG